MLIVFKLTFSINLIERVFKSINFFLGCYSSVGIESFLEMRAAIWSPSLHCKRIRSIGWKLRQAFLDIFCILNQFKNLEFFKDSLRFSWNSSRFSFKFSWVKWKKCFGAIFSDFSCPIEQIKKMVLSWQILEVFWHILSIFRKNC